MPTTRIVALVTAFFAVVGVIAYCSVNVRVTFATGGMKKLSYPVAEGLVYRARNELFPRATCDACRKGKLKVGVFSLGAFDVVEFDNLVVNIPPRAEKTQKESEMSILDSLDLKPLMTMGGVKIASRIFGIKVNGFNINKMDGEALRPVVAARVIKNSGKRIVMKDVSLFLDEGELRLGEAQLVIQPHLAIKWPGGMLDLQELY